MPSFPPYLPSAGLPHFATGIMRGWGRDTLISLGGLYLETNRLEECRLTLLAYLSVLRHGQIPNLFAEGIEPRYNSRDTTWWWLQGLQDYCRKAGSTAILRESLIRRFASDDVSDGVVEREVLVSDLVQEIMDKHARGVHFREWNAPKIDIS